MPDEKEKQKEQAEEQSEEKKKTSRPFWETIPPMYLIAGGFLIYLAINSIMSETENKNQYVILIIIVGVILYLVSKSYHPEEKLVTPKEAELLVEREIERKIHWGQFPMGTKYEVGPVINSMHRDGMGMYYDIGVKIKPPYKSKKNYVAKVMMAGAERTFVTIIEGLRPMTGREKTQETSIWPQYLQRMPGAERYRIFGNVVDDMLRGKR